MKPVFIALGIIAAILAVILTILLVCILIQRQRGKNAQWLRVNGTVIGQKKSKIPFLKRALVLYHLPTDKRNSTAVTCLLPEPPKQGTKTQFNLMIRKDRKGVTHRMLYPANRKITPTTQKIVQKVR